MARPSAPLPTFTTLVFTIIAYIGVTTWLAVSTLRGEVWAAPAAAWLVLVLAPVLGAVTLARQFARRRIRAINALTHRRLSAFVETACDMPWETTADGVITYAGPRASRLLGYDPDAIVGHHIAEVLAERELDRAAALLAASMAAGRGWIDERYTFMTLEGQEKELLSSSLVHLDSRGHPVGFMGTLREVEVETAINEEFDRIRAGVEHVLAERALRAVFQPIISLSTGAVIGAEALTRFTAEPPMSPDRWFQNANDVGLGIDLEILAAEIALDAAHLLPGDVYLSINVSPAALRSGQVLALVRQAEWPSSQLVLEITEHVSVDDYSALACSVADLRATGVRIAVDDAGAGYASFRHILQLRPDYIKVDRTLVDGLDRDPAKRALALAFVTFGSEVGAIVVAEGVENGAELRAARDLGIQAAQGYHTGRPAPAGGMWSKTPSIEC